VGTVPGVVPGGEGGLLGIAVPEGEASVVYAYFTAADDNRIVRLPLGGGAGSLTLGEGEEVLTGIPKSTTHNGGRIAFGPDGMLYATVGDAQRVDAAQDPASLSGKILRMTPDGAAPDDNPMPGSLVYSMGHRNPQGIAWDPEGGLWAAEFGQSTWDELNRIEPGANYGWPIVEGEGGDDRFVDPVAQWATDDASPSGIAIVGGTGFIANLRGERLWAVDVDGGEPRPSFVGELGRLRDAVAAPDGSLWMLTNNTDGRGAPREGDDRLVRIALGPAA
jgi:glucose/arabinose dehydrogenase